MIKRTSFVRNIARLGRRILTGKRKLSKKYRNPSFWLHQILPDQKGVAVQIGSNDGQTGDPLHEWLKKKKKWSAVLVEPVPFVFDRLKATYSGEKRFAFENAVINDGSEVTFYWVAQEAFSELSDLPSWWDQLGGFSREHIINHMPELEPFIRSKVLCGLSLKELFDRHELDSLDILHIDTEGADYKILSQLDLGQFQPRVILYEWKHLSKDEEKRSIRFLQDSYVLFNLGDDILAINKKAHEELQEKMKPLHRVRVPGL